MILLKTSKKKRKSRTIYKCVLFQVIYSIYIYIDMYVHAYVIFLAKHKLVIISWESYTYALSNVAYSIYKIKQ